MLLGGAAVNTLAFSGSNYLFSMLRSSGVDEERKRHDKVVEQLQAAHEQWSKQRTERLDWINEELGRQGHAVQTFHDVDMVIRKYARVTGHNLGSLGSKPQITDFYTPSSDQKNREIAFVVVGMAATGLVAYKLAKYPNWPRRTRHWQLLAVWQATTIIVRRVNFPPPNFCGTDIMIPHFRWGCPKSFTLLC